MVATPSPFHSKKPRRGTSLAVVATLAALCLPLAAVAQNVAIVNGKAVPKARLTMLLQQAARAGQPVPPEMESRARDEVVLREIYAQEAEKRGIAILAVTALTSLDRRDLDRLLGARPAPLRVAGLAADLARCDPFTYYDSANDLAALHVGPCANSAPTLCHLESQVGVVAQTGDVHTRKIGKQLAAPVLPVAVARTQQRRAKPPGRSALTSRAAGSWCRVLATSAASLHGCSKRRAPLSSACRT